MIQLCILFILAGFDKLDTDCGHGIADNITNHRWIDLRKASTMTWRFPSCAQCGVTEALIQILFRYQAQEDPVTFAAALGSSSDLQQDCVMLPSCQLPFFFFSSTSALVHFLSISFLLHLRSNTPEKLALHCEKRIPGLEDQSEFYGVAEGDEKWADFQSIQCLTFSLLTAPQSFLQLHAVCPVSADWLHCRLSWTLQLNSAAAVGRDSHHCWNTVESPHWRHTLQSALPVFLSVNLPEELPEHCSEHGSLLLSESW